MVNKSSFPLAFVFLIIFGILIVFRKFFELHGFNTQVLILGNLFIYVVTFYSMRLLNKGMNAINTNAFLRNAYSAILIKLFACAGAAFVYILASGKNLNKPALFTCMGLYLVYTFVELSIVMKRSNAKKNVKN